jgi:hypothetical protein
VSISDFASGPHGDRRPPTLGPVTGDRNENGSDLFATLLWGLRRYVLLVLATVLVLGILVPLMLSRRTEEFQATAQVGPSGPLLLSNTTPLPRFAESVFNNGAVEQDVRALLHQSTGNVIPAKVRLVAGQDNLVLDVVASAPTADEAMKIANQAAATFVIELNKYSASVAPFLIQHRAVLAKKVPQFGGGYLSVVLGLIAGLLVGVALVGLLLVVRRPVVEVSTAQDVTGFPVVGRISLPRKGPPRGTDGRAIGLLCRRLLATSASTIHVAAPHHGQAEQLARSMNEVFRPLRRGPSQGRTGTPGSGLHVPTVLAPNGADAWITPPDEPTYSLLLAPDGMSARKLRLFAEGHNTGAPTGVVLLSPHRRRIFDKED